MPAIRRIAHDAALEGDRFSSLIRGIALSEPFLKRTKSGAGPAAPDRFPQTTTKLQEPASGAS
jgi:hypothetical protein